MRWWASILILSWAAAGCGLKAKIAGRSEPSAEAGGGDGGTPASGPATEITRSVTLSPFGGEGLVPSMCKDLDAVLSELAGRDLYFRLEGHTDATGSEAANERVGLKRAEMVRTYLLEHHGVAKQRVDVVSYGETRPVVDNATAEHRAQNRRVVVNILAR